jgi:hypothetical protein
VVNRNKTLFLTTRIYKDPEVEALTVNRHKKDGQSKSVMEERNDVSVGSMKVGERNDLLNNGVEVRKVGVVMEG